MRSLFISLALLGAVQPAAAQFTTTYAGMQAQGGRQVPATARFSVEKGRVAMIMKGTRASRMIFDERSQVLHLINDEDKTYVDLHKTAGDSGNPMQMMQEQLDKLPPAQRAQTEQMMKSMMGSMPPQLTYVTTNDKKVIAGYESTRVEGLRGHDKVTEYCGSTSPDLKMSETERGTVLEMQSYLRNFTIMVKAPDDYLRAFQWDTSTDGYPVLTRCFVNGRMTLELTLQTVDRKPVPSELFELPKSYRKLDLSGRPGR